MGFFDRLAAKKNSAASGAPEPAVPNPATNPIRPRLDAARAHLDAGELPAALAIYEEVLATSGDRADVLVTISGDLGSTGHLAPIIDLIAPRYDGQRHGPATGLNLLQAYLALRNPDAAQHVLDILYSLNRPELEERLHGFSNAIADLIVQGAEPLPAVGDPAAAGVELPPAPKVSLISISKPIWFYGLESLADRILPPKSDRGRRIAFAQLAVPGAYTNVASAMAKPEDELSRLSRAIPLWLAETFYFSPHYAPIAAVGVVAPPGSANNQAVIFSAEWSVENLRQLVESSTGGLDYIFTGALRQTGGDYELLLRVWEVKKFRERKQFLVRWTPASMDAELMALHQQLRTFMEWSPEKVGLPYSAPTSPRIWLDALGASLGLFLVDKKILPTESLPPLTPTFELLAPQAGSSVFSSLAWLTLQARATKLNLTATADAVTLAADPLVSDAKVTLAL